MKYSLSGLRACVLSYLYCSQVRRLLLLLCGVGERRDAMHACLDALCEESG